MHQQTVSRPVLSPPCDCCGRSEWEFIFRDKDVDLGRCRHCGLHYVAGLDAFQHYEDTGILLDARLQLEDERLRLEEFDGHIDLLKRFAPPGKWMDVGCGAGMLLQRAEKQGIAGAGIELTPSRAALARASTSAPIYERPLEDLHLPDHSFAAVIAINLFSHLRAPSETLAEIGRILVPGGVLLLVTAEIGPGLRKGHNFRWTLGEELYYLGDDTIEWYCRSLGFQLLTRERKWLPNVLYSKQRFREKGSSRVRNLAKKAFLYTPGAFPLLRAFIVRKQRGNPIYSSTLVLRRATPEQSASACTKGCLNHD